MSRVLKVCPIQFRWVNSTVDSVQRIRQPLPAVSMATQTFTPVRAECPQYSAHLPKEMFTDVLNRDQCHELRRRTWCFDWKVHRDILRLFPSSSNHRHWVCSRWGATWSVLLTTEWKRTSYENRVKHRTKISAKSTRVSFHFNQQTNYISWVYLHKHITQIMFLLCRVFD